MDKGYQMSKVALEVNAKGEVRELNITDNKASLKIMQDSVGGLIQPVGITDNLVMWVNEEFLFMPELDLNAIATTFFGSVGGTYDIHGTVVFTGGLDEDGYSAGLDNTTRDKLHRIAEAVKTTFVEMGFAK